ncbi:unnamed protein product, partial [Mesorhabditis spiculigera]
MLFVVFFAALLAGANAQSQCKNDDYTMLGNGKCYRVFTSNTAGSSASAACHLTGGELVSIHSETDNYIIGIWAQGNLVSEAWIGLRCDTLDTCGWLDGTPLNYTHFDDNPPDLDDGNCFFMKVGMVDVNIFNTWAVGKCDKKKNFICEQVDHIPTKAPTTVRPSPYPFSHSPDCGTYYLFNGWCYNVFPGGLSEPDAELTCEADGGHLVAIHEAFTNNFVTQLLASIGAPFGWIGLKYLPNGVYIWTNGSPMDYRNIPAILSPALGSCFAMSTLDQYYPAQWIPYNCSTLLPFVCQRPRADVPTTTKTLPTTQVVSSCGQTQYGGYSGQIPSPNYPYSFHGSYCYYQITGSSRAVNVEVPAIQGMNGFWVLTLFEGAQADRYYLIDEISSQDFPRIIHRSSSTNLLLVTFYSADSVIGQPFFVSYNSTQVPLYPTRNGTVTPATTTVAPRKLSCDVNWSLDEQRGVCYAISSPGTFDDGAGYCRLRYAQMLSVHSLQQETGLYALLNRAYPNGFFDVWIGGKFNINAWKWWDGTAFDYSAWVGGRDNGTSSSCASAVRHGASSFQQGWVARDCSIYLPAVCYRTANINAE